MKLLDTLMNKFEAALLPPMPIPKAPKGPQGLPGYRTQTAVRTSASPKTDRNLANTDRLVSARSQSNTQKVLRELSKSSPDLSSAVSFLMRTGIPEKFKLTARDMDGKVSVEATKLAHELLRRMTYLGNVDGTFGAQMGLQSLSEALGLELILDGASCLEVALDKARIPASLNPISVTTLVMFEEDNSFKLKQRIGGEDIDLDLPTIIYVTVDQLQTEVYPSSYVESAIQPILADIDFNNDTRRALKRAVLPRLTAILDSEAVKKFTPPDILGDPEKYAAYKNALIQEVQAVVNGAAPEDAFVSYDQVDYKYIDGGQDPSAIIERIQKVLNGKLSSGAKTLPVILGQASTSNASSTEAMLYVKQANMLRVKLNEIYSRAMTIAVRIMGQDAYVEFEYEPIDLRPTRELEAYKSMEQSRILDLLSLGFLTDEEACIALTGNLPPDGYTPKSGTMFRGQGAAGQAGGNPDSNTSAMGQTLKPKAPAAPKGPVKAESDVQLAAQMLSSAHASADRAVEATEGAMRAVQDMAFAMQSSANKPVQVTVDMQPIELNLVLEQGKQPVNRKVILTKNADGTTTAEAMQ